MYRLCGIPKTKLLVLQWQQIIIDDGFCTKTTYVLQFMWRDLSSSFDAIGPYFTAEHSIETKFLISCLFESMFIFETYGFQVCSLVCDGASCNWSTSVGHQASMAQMKMKGSLFLLVPWTHTQTAVYPLLYVLPTRLVSLVNNYLIHVTAQEHDFSIT